MAGYKESSVCSGCLNRNKKNGCVSVKTGRPCPYHPVEILVHMDTDGMLSFAMRPKKRA